MHILKSGRWEGFWLMDVRETNVLGKEHRPRICPYTGRYRFGTTRSLPAPRNWQAPICIKRMTNRAKRREMKGPFLEQLRAVCIDLQRAAVGLLLAVHPHSFSVQPCRCDSSSQTAARVEGSSPCLCRLALAQCMMKLKEEVAGG